MGYSFPVSGNSLSLAFELQQNDSSGEVSLSSCAVRKWKIYSAARC